MDRVEELEAAISDLPSEDFRRIEDWLRERDQSLWDQQLDGDSSGGRLDFLFKEIEQTHRKIFSANRGEVPRYPSILDRRTRIILLSISVA